MKRRKMVLRPLGAGLGDCYSHDELFALCEQELFASSKKMDTKLLLEALRALDDRPDEVIAPRRAIVWVRIQQRIHPVTRARMPRCKFAMLVAVILLLLALAGTCIAWAIKAGVLSFPSLALPWVPQVADKEAEAIVQENLATVIYPHCALCVREAAYDGHQLRIVYSLRDTRPNAVLTDEEKRDSCIAAAGLDGLGICDYLTVDGNDIFLDDTFQMIGECEGEMLYYLSANIPEGTTLGNPMHVEMPIGQPQGVGLPRKLENVSFSLDTSASQASALYVESAATSWGNTQVTVKQAEFSPLHGYIKVIFHSIDSSKPYDAYTPALFTLDGNRVEYEWYSSYGDTEDGGKVLTIRYIPLEEWPEALLFAHTLYDGSPDRKHCLELKLIKKAQTSM